MQIGCFQQLFTNRLPCSTFEQHVIGYHHSRLSCGFQHRTDMLHKVQLFVAGGSPEILTVIGQVVFFLFPLFVGKGLAALFAEWRIGQYIIVSSGRSGYQRIGW